MLMAENALKQLKRLPLQATETAFFNLSARNF